VRVVVIGGGMAGVSIGFELAGRGAQVVLLEQEQELAYHTTGRSAAMYLQSYGNATVRALTMASRGDFDALQAIYETPPLLTPLPLLWTSDAEGRADLEELLRPGGPVQPVTAEEAVAICPVLRRDHLVAAALDTESMSIDVPSLHQAYVRGLHDRGGEIRRAQAVTGLGREGYGWRVSTHADVIRADMVVNAAGAWADVIAEMAGVQRVGLRPLRRTIFTSPVTGHGDISGWPFISDIAERYYFHGEHDQVIVSPADEIPDKPRDVRPEEVDIAGAIEVVNEFTTLGLRSVRKAWAGLRSFVADRSPVVGARADEPGFFWFAGQGGYGIQMAPALARAGASVLVDSRVPPDIAALGVTPAALGPDRLATPTDAIASRR
jgi:D-arginine dehydrogenase